MTQRSAGPHSSTLHSMISISTKLNHYQNPHESKLTCRKPGPAEHCWFNVHFDVLQRIRLLRFLRPRLFGRLSQFNGCILVESGFAGNC